jgi:hypothetical protein
MTGNRNISPASAFLLIALASLLTWQCRTNSELNDQEVNRSPDSIAVFLERGACFGRCPVYSLTVYRSGYAIYHGKQNVKHNGTFEKKFDPVMLNEVFELAGQLGYFEMDNEYRNPHLTDFPTIRSAINDGSRSNKVLRYTDDPPADLLRIEEQIDALFSPDESWKKKAENPQDLN